MKGHAPLGHLLSMVSQAPRSTLEVDVESLSKELTDKRVAISKIAVPLGIGTAMIAEVVGVCVLTGILDLVLNNNLSVKNFHQCIDAIIRKSGVRLY